jgi:uncharacterized protein
VKIVNQTKGFTISEDAQMRETFFGRFRGLMLSRRMDVVLATAKEGVLESTIHMMYMLYPIDVIWADKDMKVVDVKKDVPPFNPLRPRTWAMHKPAAPAKYVIEIAMGDVGATERGDKLEFSS